MQEPAQVGQIPDQATNELNNSSILSVMRIQSSCVDKKFGAVSKRKVVNLGGQRTQHQLVNSISLALPGPVINAAWPNACAAPAMASWTRMRAVERQQLLHAPQLLYFANSNADREANHRPACPRFAVLTAIPIFEGGLVLC
jgi:hypothetical protein